MQGLPPPIRVTPKNFEILQAYVLTYEQVKYLDRFHAFYHSEVGGLVHEFETQDLPFIVAALYQGQYPIGYTYFPNNSIEEFFVANDAHGEAAVEFLFSKTYDLLRRTLGTHNNAEMTVRVMNFRGETRKAFEKLAKEGKFEVEKVGPAAIVKPLIPIGEST
jgi:hypothetical protein